MLSLLQREHLALGMTAWLLCGVGHVSNVPGPTTLRPWVENPNGDLPRRGCVIGRRWTLPLRGRAIHPAWPRYAATLGCASANTSEVLKTSEVCRARLFLVMRMTRCFRPEHRMTVDAEKKPPRIVDAHYIVKAASRSQRFGWASSAGGAGRGGNSTSASYGAAGCGSVPLDVPNS